MRELDEHEIGMAAGGVGFSADGAVGEWLWCARGMKGMAACCLPGLEGGGVRWR